MHLHNGPVGVIADCGVVVHVQGLQVLHQAPLQVPAGQPQTSSISQTILHMAQVPKEQQARPERRAYGFGSCDHPEREVFTVVSTRPSRPAMQWK